MEPYEKAQEKEWEKSVGAWQYHPQCVVQFGSASTGGVVAAVAAIAIAVVAEYFVQDEWI